MKAPHEYSRRILLLVTGLSPQIVTETVYALAVASQPRFVPTEVHLLTTTAGAARANLALLSQAPGWFKRLRDDYQLPEIHFSARNIHVVQDATGNALADIRAIEDNERAANAITAQVCQLTKDPRAAVHVSIAGGRKTMGFYAGYALSLYGREQDRLSHVLVNAPYEGLADFYYPTPYENVVYTHGPKPEPINTAEAEVTLAEIPFVRLREGLSPELLKQGAGFGTLVNSVQTHFDTPEVNIDWTARSLICGKAEMPFNASQWVFYAWFCERTVLLKEDVRADDESARDFLQFARAQLPEGSSTLEQIENALGKYAWDITAFSSRRSKVNKALVNTLGKRRAQDYLIHANGKRPNTCYGLRLEAEQIHSTTA